MKRVKIIGGGLAGCEAALRLAGRGIAVELVEAKPLVRSPAHTRDTLGELVCSNSLKSADRATASGQLKAELSVLRCSLLAIAERTAVPAGSALAVDRNAFSEAVTRAVEAEPLIAVIRRVADSIDWDEPTVIATGPLTLGGLADDMRARLGGSLHFYDAAAPIVSAASVDMTKTFGGSRYGKGGGDYVNCPLDKAEYEAFVDALLTAETAETRDFDKREVFEGCMPVEIMASRGRDTLRFGPMRPVGFTDPASGKRPYAVVQLRRENAAGGMYNLVGFQTNLKFGEQKRVFSMIPALRGCEILRYGVMHRNSFVNAPLVLNPGFDVKRYPSVFVAGQLSGVEGYAESIASGLVAAINAERLLQGEPPLTFPPETIIGALQRYLASENPDFQPMNANFGILPPLENPPRDKRERKAAYTARGEQVAEDFQKRYRLV